MVVPRGTKIKVKTKDLPTYCKIKVDVQCDICSKKLKVQWSNYKKYVRQNNMYYCKNCFLNNRNIINNKSIIKTHPDIVEKYFINLEDAYKYSIGSNKKILTKCPDCGYKNSKPKRINKLTKQKYYCPKCNDHISYPNKFMFNLLCQLKNYYNFNFEVEKTFDWLIYENNKGLHKGRVDGYFVFNDQRYALEMDGGFHNKNTSFQTKEESIFIDEIKSKLCQNHDIQVIRINCCKSELKFIKNNILTSELNKIFDLSIINWLECHEYACKNIVKEICNLWNNGIKNSTKIAKQFKISKTTVNRYLKQGVELGWCDYDPKEEIKKGQRCTNKEKHKLVKCLTTKKIFKNIAEASRYYNINPKCISNNCKGIQYFAGKHPETGEKMKWEYFNKN
jgi:hypothetical protein